jgi:hypothetical protein
MIAIMNLVELYIIAGVGIIMVAIIIIQKIRYRKIIKEKNLWIFQQLKEQNQLVEKLERMRIEKEFLVKILETKLNT